MIVHFEELARLLKSSGRMFEVGDYIRGLAVICEIRVRGPCILQLASSPT
jgi:hypothetical protein